MINQAKEMIKNEIFSCIILKNNKIIHNINGRGIKPLLSLYENNKTDLNNSFVLDRVIGKAAAKLIIDAQVKYIYGYVMSKNAIVELEKNNIEFEYEILIDNILNKDGTDLCPMEKIALQNNDTQEMINEIKNFLNKIK